MSFVGVNVEEVTSLGWGTVGALHPLVVLVPEASSDMVLVVDGTSTVSEMADTSRGGTVLGHLSSDDLPVIFLHLLALSTSFGETKTVEVCFGPTAEFDGIGDGMFGTTFELLHVIGTPEVAASCRDVMKVSRIDGVVISVDMMEVTSLRRVTVMALNPSVVLIPEASGDVQLGVS